MMLIFYTALLLVIIFSLVYFSANLNIASILLNPPNAPPLAKADFTKLFGSLFGFVDLYKKYGKTFRLRIGLSTGYFISDPADIAAIFNVPRFIDKAGLYDKIKFHLGDTIVTENGEEWLNHRKLLNSCFAYKPLQEHSRQLTELARHNMQNIKQNVPVDEEVDIELIVKTWVFNNLCETVLGMKPEGEEFFKAYKECAKFKMDYMKMLLPKFIYNITADGRKLIENHRYFWKLTSNAIIEKETSHKCNYPGAKFVLDEMIKSGQFTEEQIRSNILLFLIAGHDTVLLTVCCCIYQLSRNQDIQKKVFDEIANVLPVDRKVPVIDDLNRLKYLKCVIKETMRMYPALVTLGRNVSQPVQLSDGYIIPPGSNVYVNATQVHYNHEIFPEPHKFNPDRFLNAIISTGCFYIPFGIGMRNCIGYKFGMIEMQIILTAIVNEFEILPSSKELNIYASYTSQMRGGAWVILKRRNR